MRCTLNIPHLIPPHEVISVWHQLPIHTLKSMLQRARYTRHTSMHDIAGFTSFDVSAAAPLLAAADGLDAETGYWLCAMPVHLETRRHALVLADPADLKLSAAESAALAETIAQHVRGEQLVLHTSPSGRWYLRRDSAPAMTTSPLDEVIGRDLQAFLPQGPDALTWHRLLTEIQMLLHAHPVNHARENAGHLPANSVWLWGGATMPAAQRSPYAAVWSDDPATVALALRAGCRVDAKSTHDAAAPRFPADRETVEHYFFSFNALKHCMRRGDLQAWSAAVTALDRDWFQPLQAALKARRVTQATLISQSTDESVHEFTFGPWDRYKLFNKIKYL